jgi:hypothetical protein
MIGWAFELLISYMNGEGVVTESSNRLIQGMYYIPETLSTIIYGDFRYIDSDGFYYGSTDAGYMRMMLYFGIFGSALFYANYIYFTLSAKSKSIGLLALLLLVAEVKGDAILASPASKLYMLLIAYSMVSLNSNYLRKYKANSEESNQ